jgi:hypothetical protein
LGVDEFMAEQNFVNERELWKSKRDLVINQVPITTKQSLLNCGTELSSLHLSKRDLVINQVPITTKQALLNYGTLMKLLAVTNKRRTAL